MRFWKEKRRNKVRARSFLDEWRDLLTQRVPLYMRLPLADRDELHNHIHVLLDEKRFEGCAGLEITDDIRLTIIAQAAVLLLHRDTDYYSELSSILVYPSSYVAPAVDYNDGIVTEFEEERSGETWSHGSLVLAWNDITNAVTGPPIAERPEEQPGNGGLPGRSEPHVQRPTKDVTDDRDGELVPAYNVVLHEFAHQLDLESGDIDGMPKLESRDERRRWIEVMEAAFERLRLQYDNGQEAVIDYYALEEPGEFFAVITESFFETPFAILEEYPDLYAVLSDYYRQDPAQWETGGSP
jgi:Mlc titration factor MtfA (ptsG expression regulator)